MMMIIRMTDWLKMSWCIITATLTWSYLMYHLFDHHHHPFYSFWSLPILLFHPLLYIQSSLVSVINRSLDDDDNHQDDSNNDNDAGRERCSCLWWVKNCTPHLIIILQFILFLCMMIIIIIIMSRHQVNWCLTHFAPFIMIRCNMMWEFDPFASWWWCTWGMVTRKFCCNYFRRSSFCLFGSRVDIIHVDHSNPDLKSVEMISRDDDVYYSYSESQGNSSIQLS